MATASPGLLVVAQVLELAVLRGEISAQVLDVLVGERGREARHDGVLARAALVFVQRLGDVVGVLAGDARVLRIDGLVAVGAVAGGAGLRLLLAVAGIAFGVRERGEPEGEERGEGAGHGHRAHLPSVLERYAAMSSMSCWLRLWPCARMVGCGRSPFLYAVSAAIT